jgi:hypothetical protein
MPAGRPLKFQSIEKLQEQIDAYFSACDAHTVQKVTKDGDVVDVIEPKAYTVSGLAVALDTFRDVLMDYENRDDEFSIAIKRAKAKCLACAEDRLYSDFTPGVIFSMKNNYGFKDKTESENTNHFPGEVKVTFI